MNKSQMIMSYPATWWQGRWREALPLGNGELGAAVYGDIAYETIMLTHGDLWWRSPSQVLPDVSHKLKELREAMFAGRIHEGDRLYKDAFFEQGYNPGLAYPLPLGDIKISMQSNQAFRHYSRSLDMAAGEVSVAWQDGEIRYKRNCFVSRSDNVFVMRIRAGANMEVSATVGIERHDTNDAIYQRRYENTAIDLDTYLPQNCQSFVDGDMVFYSAANDDGTDFGAVAKVIAGQIDRDDAVLYAKDSSEILILVKTFIKDQRTHGFEFLRKELEKIKSCSYEELLRRHMAEHQTLLESATFDIGGENHDTSNEAMLMASYSNETPAALIEKLWYYGRYLLIASSREGGHPCHLYGLWCGEYQGMWAMNMLNENVQMIYWHALSGNMPELMFAVFDYYERMMDDFRENARKVYGCRGIFIPAPTAPGSGLLAVISPHIIYWTGGAGWLAQHYFDYYLHTMDLDFLKKRAMPFMTEAALFYEDFFIIGDDGYYISCPSNSPENTPGNYWDGKGMGASMETTINATMDFAIARELFNNLVKAAKLLDYDEALIAKWQGMADRVPPYELNEDGAVKEWMHEFFEDNYHHRHESHVYPVFPGIEVTKESDPVLFNGFVKAIEKRLLVGLGEQSGWSLVHMANNYARMGRGNDSLNCIEIMTRSCMLNNLYTLHNDWRKMGIGVRMPWAPVQLDANMGLCSAINEMLMMSVPGRISILPALPDKWQKGKVTGLLARGAVLISIDWNMDEGKTVIILEAKYEDQTIDLVLPDWVAVAVGYELLEKQIRDVTIKTDERLKITLYAKGHELVL